MLAHLAAADQKTLLILPNTNKNILLASRNLPQAAVTPAAQTNTYDLLKARKLLISETALAHLTQSLSQP